MKSIERKLSVAPMMDWTDRHCRYFHRLLSAHTLLYTEMVTAPAVIHGDQARLLGFDECEHPVALQLGGSDPAQLAQASKIANDWGYDEVNLNVGCPSDRVQSGSFGAVLMKDPQLVADCVDAMQNASNAEVTVKCRIGVDDQIPAEILPEFLETVSRVGIKSFTIHARMAWLEGLSPKENRDIPPLDYGLVHQMKADFRHLEICLNGGIADLQTGLVAMDQGLDGMMIGRAAYHKPWDILAGADAQVFGADPTTRSREDIVDQLIPYIERHLKSGGRLHHITRHILGLFSGTAGARQWKRHISENAHKEGAGPEVLIGAMEKMNAARNAA